MQLGLTRMVDPRLLPLVADSRAFYAQRAARRGPDSLEELRAVRASTTAPAACEPRAAEALAVADGSSVRLRIHAPVGRKARGVLLEIHGGGFYMGSAAGSDVRNRQLADALGVVVASVDCRLAPEHPWPAAAEDCETAAMWLLAQAERRFGVTKLVVGGFSAGATLAMTTLLRLRGRGTPGLMGAVLQFGTYDLSGQTPAGRLIADEYLIEAYTRQAPDRTNPDISPIFAELSSLPPVLMVIGEADILLHDNLAMAARLSASGNDVDLRVYPASPHGFTGHPTPMARAALDDMHMWLRDRLASGSGRPAEAGLSHLAATTPTAASCGPIAKAASSAFR